MSELDSELCPDDLRFKYDIAANDALDTAADPAMTIPQLQTQHIHPAAWSDWGSEFDVGYTAEPNEPFPTHKSARVKRRELGAAFDHEHAWKQRPARDMSGHPELTVLHILKANDLTFFGIGEADSVELFHVAALGVRRPHPFLIEENLVEVDVGNIKKELWRH